MPSLSDILHTTAARNPDRVALIFGDQSYTYREFDAAVERMASVIASCGVSRGDRVLLLSGNTDTFAIAAYAILRTGAILVPANPRSAAPELSYLLDDSGASVVIAAPDLAELAVSGSAGRATSLLFLGDVQDESDLLSLSASTELAPLPVWPVESDDALIIYTSGTTGRPKGALFDHHRSIWVGINMSTVWGMQEQERMLHVAPLYHAAELCLMLFPGTMAAATHIILPAFDPLVVVRAIAEQRITVFFGVPTMYQWILGVSGLDDLDLSSWRVGLFGAAPMPASVVTSLIEKLPGVNLFQLCGQTEGGPGGVYSGPEDVRARPDASGRYALPNTEFKAIGAGGADAKVGEVGELVLRGETVMKGYWNRPDETAAALKDGWLHTGDIALIDEDGYITLVDRLKDMIISGGRNVYSVEVENALMAHPDIIDVAVLGIPHPEFGESILAVIVSREGSDPQLAEVRAWARTQISDYKIPHQLISHAIPRNPSGKIQKHILRAQLEETSVSMSSRR